jgi:PAS domain S-box-containing protein
MEILGNLRSAVLCLGRDWKLTYANQAARRISRIEPAHLNSKTYWQLFPDDVGTELEYRYRRVMADRAETIHIFFYVPLQIWIDQRIFPIETGIALMYQDVTAQKLEESARLSTIRHLEQVMEQTSDGIFYLDHSYNFTFLNRRAKELLGPDSKLIGTCVWEAFPAMFHEGSAWVENYRLSMDQKLPCEFEMYYPEPLNKWFCIESKPADNGIIIFLRDATKDHLNREAVIHKAQEAEERRAEIETLYRTAPAGLALLNAFDFRYLRLNDQQAEYYGIPADELLGHLVTEGTQIKGLHELFERVSRGEPVHEQLLEGELPSQPGEYRYWTVNYHPVRGSDGGVRDISMVSVEITQQKRAEAALLRSEKLAAVGRLATSISHEINNPLESVTNLLYLIAIDTALPNSIRPYVNMAQEELARVSQIATETLRFHRQSIRPALVDASHVVNAVMVLYASRLINASVRVETRFQSRTLFLCYESDLRQVLSNLITNAIDAMQGGGILRIRSHDATDPMTGQRGVRLSIADTGCGMSAITQSRACEPFYTTKEANGSGLGLWISSDIVNRNGGRLRFRSSTHPDHHGTVFTVFQPLILTQIRAESQPEHEEGNDLAQHLAS